MKNGIKNTGMLLLTAIIWGFAFVAQSAGMEYVGPFTFSAVRCLIGGAVLIPVAIVWSRGEERKFSKDLLAGGVLCGIALAAAMNVQQLGIMTTSVGKAGFLTALYIVIVPVIGIFFHRKCAYTVWIGVVCSLIGLYLLCMTDGQLQMAKGDWLLIASAVLFSVHILLIDHFSPKVNGVQLSCVQFLVAGAISSVAMFAAETPTAAGLWEARWPVLYAGVLSSGIGYTLQILGQKNYNPTIAVLILSLESCFSVVGGFLILREELSERELLGCVLMFAAIVLAQLPKRQKKERAALQGE